MRSIASSTVCRARSIVLVDVDAKCRLVERSFSINFESKTFCGDIWSLPNWFVQLSCSSLFASCHLNRRTVFELRRYPSWLKNTEEKRMSSILAWSLIQQIKFYVFVLLLNESWIELIILRWIELFFLPERYNLEQQFIKRK